MTNEALHHMAGGMPLPFDAKRTMDPHETQMDLRANFRNWPQETWTNRETAAVIAKKTKYISKIELHKSAKHRQRAREVARKLFIEFELPANLQNNPRAKMAAEAHRKKVRQDIDRPIRNTIEALDGRRDDLLVVVATAAAHVNEAEHVEWVVSNAKKIHNAAKRNIYHSFTLPCRYALTAARMQRWGENYHAPSRPLSLAAFLEIERLMHKTTK